MAPTDHDFAVLVDKEEPVQAQPNQWRQVLTTALPIILLGLLVAACVLDNASMKKSTKVLTVTSLWDSSAEEAHSNAVSVAEHIDYAGVNGITPIPVDPDLLKEVEKAEAEQAQESQVEAAFAAGKTPDPPKGGSSKAVSQSKLADMKKPQVTTKSSSQMHK
mmetsp:Transcript_32036/g.50040  ORF Transcript_32036/g.50040 Transcript_32036/m.50040 type:complete len:162 (-) Transcript_32036:134-619(-)